MTDRISRRAFVAAAALAPGTAAAAQAPLSTDPRSKAFRRGAEITARDFGVRGDGRSDDSAALQAAVDHAISTGIGRVKLGAGEFVVRSTIQLRTRGVAIIGSDVSNRQFGSTPRSSSLIWEGGAAPIFRCSTSFGTFAGLAVENRGAATDFLEINGGVGFLFDDLSFVHTMRHRPFSRSVIRTNGNSLGYSIFRQVTAKSPAPVFIDIDGQGSGNGITNLLFEDRCIFDSNAGRLTVLRMTDESIENLTIRDCTFNVNGPHELTIVDTTGRPLPSTINCLTFEANEIDVVERLVGTERFFRLVNVRNMAFDNNVVNAGGYLEALASLTNCNVTSCEGNYWKSLDGPLFAADASSSITCGSNYPEPSNTQGIFDVAAAGVEELSPGRFVDVELKHGNARPHMFLLNARDADKHEFRIANSPRFLRPAAGATLTITIRNVTRGSIAAPAFDGRTFSTQGPAIAPAPGFNRSFTFYWDGNKAIEITRTARDVPNS